jgi:hypothetical protein
LPHRKTPPDPDPTHPLPPRQALLRALVAALGKIHSDRTSQSEGLVAADQPSPPDATRTCPGTTPGGPAEQVEVVELTEAILYEAERQADDVGNYLNYVVDHLEAIGCPPTEVLNYLRLGKQTLASLYLLAAKGNPSPMEMRRLALRYALDARRPVADLARFMWKREPGGWRIAEYPADKPWILPSLPPGRLVKGLHAVQVLDCVLADPPAVPRLMEVIENILEKVPGALDALPTPGKPAFIFQISVERGACPRVRLWLNDKEIPLKWSEDVHKLLRELCRDPAGQFSGSALKRRQIINPSRAVKVIREALDQTYPGAGGWLLTHPVRWADGHAPEERHEKPCQ